MPSISRTRRSSRCRRAGFKSAARGPAPPRAARRAADASPAIARIARDRRQPGIGPRFAPRSPRPTRPPFSLPSHQIRTSLLHWYDGAHRILPWRRNPFSRLGAEAAAAGAPLDMPTQDFMYRVWVCEVMAQQTQLDRVKKYWTEWMVTWPSVSSLAAASEEDVRAAWAGLGYYRRAAFLLKGARYVVDELKGVFPTDVAALTKIPGVGAYTGAAMASIAAGTPAAVVDGNVIRVLSRLRALAGDPKSGAAGKAHARLAARLLDPARPGDFNQAVMELGATVCTPSGAPACGSCPVAAVCAARARHAAGLGAATDFPTPVAKAAKREERVAVCVVEAVDGGSRRVLLQKRPEGGLLAGLWEFPSVPVPSDAAPSATKTAVDAHVALLLGEALPRANSDAGEAAQPSSSLRLLRRAPVGDIVHIFSHIRMTLAVEHARVDAGGAGLSAEPRDADPSSGRPATRWVDVDTMAEEKVSSSVAKCWRLVASGGGGAATAAKRAAAPAAAPTGQGSIKKFFSAAKKE